MSHKIAIRNKFNQAAAGFDQVAVLTQEVGQRLLQRLSMLKITPNTIVDLGCNTGEFTQKLQQQFPQAQLYAVDIAEKMLHQTQAKYPDAHFHTICAGAEQLPLADNSVDLIFSNLVFHWCQDITQALRECQRVLRADGLLLFAMYGPATLQELRQSWQAVDEYEHVNYFHEVREVGNYLMQAGLQEPVTDTETLLLTYPEVVAIFRELKRLGANHLSVAKQRLSLTGKQRWQNMLQHYQQFRLANGQFPATYEIVYGAAWGQANQLQQSNPQEVFISVEDIKK
jgi:malonyl-CoA O-methyltransferase